MIWLVWRRQRAALLAAVGVAVLLAGALVALRLLTLSGAARLGVTECLTDSPSDRCGSVVAALASGRWGSFYSLTRFGMLALPVVLGILGGAGLFAREVEFGTHVLALTQSVGRLRWWATGLLVCGVPVAVLAEALVAVDTWAQAPFPALVDPGVLQTPDFEAAGVMPAAYTLLAFTLAASAGLLLRSTVGAAGLALVLQVAVQLLLSAALREHYVSPETTRVDLTAGNSVPAGGLFLGYGYIDAAGREHGPDVLGDSSCDAPDFESCLRAAGMTQQFVRYQPADRFWPFQGIESTIVLALVAGTLGAGAWGLRKRIG